MSRGELGKFCVNIVGRNLMPVTVGTEKVLVVLLSNSVKGQRVSISLKSIDGNLCISMIINQH